jgi:hypothetical protein
VVLHAGRREEGLDPVGLGFMRPKHTVHGCGDFLRSQFAGGRDFMHVQIRGFLIHLSLLSSIPDVPIAAHADLPIGKPEPAFLGPFSSRGM